MDPQHEYTSRREHWLAERQGLDRLYIRIGNYRLAIVLAAALLAWVSLWRGALSGWWLLVPFALFAGLVVWHARIARRQTLAQRGLAYYDRGLARLDDRWAGTGNIGEGFRNPEHVYADDLDVFGRGSLFELIDTARTATGEKTLASWFLAPASRETVLARQEAGRELRDRLDLREDIALLGEEVRAEVHSDALHEWGSAPAIHFARALRPAAIVLSVAAIGALAAFLAGVIPLSPFFGVLAGNAIFIALVRRRTKHIIENVETPSSDLRVLSLMLARLETEQFTSPLLRDLRETLDVQHRPASRRIARLERWIELLDSSDHVLVRALAPLILWREQIAMGIEAWRRDSGQLVGAWLETAGHFEALSSLAALSYERPAWAFPRLTEGAAPQFEARALLHPLLPAARSVPNDVNIGDDLRLLIVSGSNMSGKSTLLRAIGLNTVLAWAGAPVAARELRISALRVGASLRALDSLQDGRSRFFAEISRIRQVMDLANGDRPVLFLLDELLSGTNSHDRRIGATAIVKALVDRGAVGLITTHDLALAQIEQGLGGAAKNVHFDDQIVDGRIEFDYRLREGVVVRSNALELMRAVGLPV
ncbi:MAG: hypothetical protein WBW33_16680 [Bryobacteraceae bacterium]